MIRSWSFLIRSLALVLCLCRAQDLGAATKPWVLLTNCQYVANTEADGDSFPVRAGTNQFMLRLYYVDAPETNLRYPERTREQSEYFGVTLDESMKGAREAREFVREKLREPFTIWTRWATAGGRSKEPRYYGLVMVGTNSLDELLISKGLARPKGVQPNLPNGEKAKAHVARLDALETEAKRHKAGLWASSRQNHEAAPP